MPKLPRSIAAAGATLVVALGVGAMAAPALAAQDPVLTPEQQQTLQSQIDAHKACIEQQGVTLPEKPEDGTRPELTDEQRQALRAARETCADQRPERPELSDEQRAQLRAQVEEHRTCMEEQLSAAGITKPERPTRGSGPRPARPELTDEQKAAIESARTACADLEPNLGVDRPGPIGHHRGHGPRVGGPGGRGPGGPGGPQGEGDSSGNATRTTGALI